MATLTDLGRRYTPLTEPDIDWLHALVSDWQLLADPRDARLLGVDVGMPLLLLSRQAFDQTGTPVEWAQSRYRGDRYKLVTRLHRGGTRVPRTGE